VALNDIRIHKQVDFGTAGYPITTGMTFRAGEVVVVAAAGTLSEAGDDPATVTGIAMGDSQGKDANGQDGTVPDGTLISVYKPTAGQLFKVTCGTGDAGRFATDGAGTAAAAALTTVGDTAGFTLTGGNWFLDTGASNIHAEIVAVLDENGAPLGDTNVRTTGTATTVVFGFI
jgi:hypothetical protein